MYLKTLCFSIAVMLLTACASDRNDNEEIQSIITVQPYDNPDTIFTQLKLPDSLLANEDDILYGDFNGDQIKDIAARVINLGNGFHGVIIIHDFQNQPEYFIYGAGKEVNGMHNLDWIGIFEAIPAGTTVTYSDVEDSEEEDTPTFDKRLATDGIYMHVYEGCGGGILLWNGRDYDWLHQE